MEDALKLKSSCSDRLAACRDPWAKRDWQVIKQHRTTGLRAFDSKAAALDRAIARSHSCRAGAARIVGKQLFVDGISAGKEVGSYRAGGDLGSGPNVRLQPSPRQITTREN